MKRHKARSQDQFWALNNCVFHTHVSQHIWKYVLNLSEYCGLWRDYMHGSTIEESKQAFSNAPRLGSSASTRFRRVLKENIVITMQIIA
jgi:hypothetical protein